VKPDFLLNTRKATYATQAVSITTQETHATQVLALTKYTTQTRVAKRKRTQEK